MDDDLKPLALLCEALLDGRSNTDRTMAELQMQGLLHDEPRRLLIGCARLICTDSHRAAFVAFNILTRTLEPTTAMPVRVIRSRMADLLSDDERMTLMKIVFDALRHSHSNIRSCAVKCIPLLSCVELGHGLLACRQLFAIIGSPESADELRLAAISTLRGIYESSFIAEIGPDAIFADLHVQVPFFYSALESATIYPPAFICEVMLVLAALIPNAIELFGPPPEQEQLLTFVFKVCPIVTDIRLYDSIHVLFRVALQQYYATWEPVVQRIPDLTFQGICCADREWSSISLRFWRGFCFWEWERACCNSHIDKYEAELILVSTEEARKNCADVHPWHRKPLHSICHRFVENCLPAVFAILFDVDRSPEDTSSAVTLLRLLGKGWPDSVFPLLANALSTQSRDDSAYPRCIVLCIEVFCSAPESHSEIDVFIGAHLDEVMRAVVEGDSELSERAFDVLGVMIYRLRSLFSPGCLDSVLDWLFSFEVAETQLSALCRCFTALLECPLARDPDCAFPHFLLLHLTNAIELMIPRLDDPAAVGSGFRLLELLVSLLRDDDSELVISYCQSVLSAFAAIPSMGLAPYICVALQQGHLSLLGVLFQRHQTSLVSMGCEVIAFLLQGAAENVGLIMVEFVVALTQIVSGFPEEAHLPESAPDLVHRLWNFIAWVREQGDIPMLTEACFLLARLGGPPEFLVSFLATVKSALEDPSFLPPFFPGLLNGLASVIRVFPGELDDELLRDLLSLYHAAWSIPLHADDHDEVRYLNLVYEALFRGLGALIFVARNQRRFLAAHRDAWFQPVARCVQHFGLMLCPETLVAYLFFLQDALNCLPARCQPALAKVYVRVPLICLFAMNADPAVDDLATLIWDRLCPDDS
jgi:predicted regulator of Ras-like GTPase activity (Roadblock/LC7/MglB family)